MSFCDLGIGKMHYLLGIRKLNEDITDNMLLMAELRAKLTDISSHNSGERVVSSPSGGKMDSIVAKIIEIDEKTDFLIDVMHDYKEKADEVLMKMDHKYYEVMWLYYVAGKTNREIALDIGLSVSSVKKIKHAGLEEYKRLSAELR